LQRYSFLSGYSLRSDAEQAELEALQIQLRDAELDPGWDVVERTVIQTEPTPTTTSDKASISKKGGSS
jgi:hypothetical protein